MPIVTDPAQTRELLDVLRRAEVALPCFCSENPWTTEAVLEASVAAGRRFGLAHPPVSLSFCASYHARQHLSNYWFRDAQRPGFRGLMGD
ncbi:MAG: hypothetical protein PVJ27_12200, partial [Candidatus Brocadiaceae bacterium]